MREGETIKDQEVLEQWKRAKKLASPLGPFSNIFSHCVRNIRNDCRESGGAGLNNLKLSTKQDLRRIFGSPTLQAMFYYALLTFYEDELKKVQHLSSDKIAQILGCEALSSMITLSYLFRRTRFISDPDNFSRIVHPMQNYIDLGFQMGLAIQEIGPAAGIITGGFRYLAFAIFLGADEKGYRNYRLHLKRTQSPFDLAFEAKQWGCTHLQIGSFLLQSFGFGVEEARAYLEGISAQNHRFLDKSCLRYKVASIWLDSLILNGRAPEVAVGDEYLVSDIAVDVLESRINEILTDGSHYKWLSKSRKDISPEKTPQLFGPESDLQRSPFASQFDTAPDTDRTNQQDSEIHDFESM